MVASEQPTVRDQNPPDPEGLVVVGKPVVLASEKNYVVEVNPPQSGEAREIVVDSQHISIKGEGATDCRDGPIEVILPAGNDQASGNSKVSDIQQQDHTEAAVAATKNTQESNSTFNCIACARDTTTDDIGSSANAAAVEVESNESKSAEPNDKSTEALSSEQKGPQEAQSWSNIFAILSPFNKTPTSSTADAEKEMKIERKTSKLFGDDLSSLPSVKDDFTATNLVDDGTEIIGRDDGSKGPHDTSASYIESKVNQIGNPQATDEIQAPNVIVGDQSLEARRKILVRELRSAISTFGRFDVRCANISAALGDVLDESKEHEQAARLHREAVSIYSCKLGDDHSLTMSSRMRLGKVYENGGKYDEAISAYYLVMSMRRLLKSDTDPSVADSLVAMSQTMKMKGDHTQAIKELKRALKIYRESLGDAHDKVAATVDEIASLYVTIGDYNKSAAILEEVVKLKAATKGVQSNAVAETLCSLATAYECSERFAHAMKALKKAYKIYTEIGGYSSEDSTTTLNRIAELYETTGDNHRASIAYLGVLRGRKINYGNDNLKVGETYYRLGRTLRQTSQYEKSLRCMKEALPIFVGKGEEMQDVETIAEIMHEMGMINKEKKHYLDAARIFRQELSVRRKVGMSEYPTCARALNHLGVVELELRNHSRALKYLVEALTILQDEGEQGIECAEILFNTGLVFEAVRNKERALEAFVEAARIFKEHGYSESHPHVVRANQKVAKNTRGGESSSVTSGSPMSVDKKPKPKVGLLRMFK